MALIRLVRGTTVPNEYVLRLANNQPPILGAPGLGQAVVNAELTPVLGGAGIERSCLVEEYVDGVTFARVKQGTVAVALALDPAMPLGVYRGRFRVAYADGTVEFFPSDEPFDLVVLAA